MEHVYTFPFNGTISVKAESLEEAQQLADELLGMSVWQHDHSEDFDLYIDFEDYDVE